MRACRREPVPYTPIWLMRQAGRYMAEYRAVRAGHTMLELCKSPDLVAEVTTFARKRIGADAAILFADLLLVVEPLGLKLTFEAGEGPVIDPPVRGGRAVDALREVQAAELSYVYDAVRATRAALEDGIPLIGFAGAPFTVASYLVEGGPSKEHAKTKAMMFGAPDVWDALMRKIAAISAAYLRVQVEAGASAVQLFDSWAGALTPADYEASVMPHSARVLAAAGELGVPRIHFGVGTGSLLGLMGEAGADVVGVDWRTPLEQAVPLVGDHVVQGNLDPTLVFAPTEVMTARAAEVIEAGRAARGHIFNLGHGVIPTTDPDQLARLTEFVQSY